jgi:hypothetical protein
MAKTTPYPPCTVTALWLKYQDRDRMQRRVTQPPHIAGPLLTSLKEDNSGNFAAKDKKIETTNA